MPPSEAAATPAAPAMGRDLQRDWAALNPLGDLRVRFGIKMGLAMILALWIAQLFRLPYPNWSILAVLVLMNAHFVGAIANKALMRALGTLIGALIGVWVVGDFGNTPWAFLFWVSVVVFVASYKFGHLASAAAPYAYFLVGNTLLSVSTYGLPNPSAVWHVGLYRTLETLVGVASATFVTGIIWPRHAREEFIQGANETLGTARQLLNAEARAYVGDAVDPQRVVDLRRVFSRQIMGLRTLLQSGGRGSAYFQAHLGDYQRFLVSLTHLFQAVLELQRRRAEEAELLALVRPELERVISEIDSELSVLSSAGRHGYGLPATGLNAAVADLEAKVKVLRDQGTFRRASPAAGEAFFGHFATLRLIRDELNLLREISGELPRARLAPASPRKRRPILPSIDWFWVRAAIKGSVSVCLALLIVEWLHPPGSTAIPLCAWIFSLFGRPFLNAGGTGDLRIFQNVFITAACGLPVVALLWLIMPLLSNYWAMNVFLFLVSYAFGYATARTQGVSFRMQVAILAINSVVALNPQVPVAFSTLMNAYLGLMTGMVLAALVARLLWPVLPQGLLRGNLIRYFTDLRNLLGGLKDQEFILTGTVLLPIEALRAVEKMMFPGCSKGERERLDTFIRVAQPLGMQVTLLRQFRRLLLPEAANAELHQPFTTLEATFDQFLEKLAESFRRRTGTGVEFPDLDAPMGAVESALSRVRDEGILASEDVETVAHLLELVDRYHALTERLLLCRDRLRELSLHCYLGDVAL
ncbi:MAG: FUSC family protein [Verrucomicrobia bacterium]|nr:FUSC family protein [Verrucomicrobiota bacterium]